MTKEEIEKAAEQNISCENTLDLGTILENVGRESFVLGAKWRINSVWHDASEMPKHKSLMILAIREDGSSERLVFVEPNRWKRMIELCSISKWAYIKDLIPNNY